MHSLRGATLIFALAPTIAVSIFAVAALWVQLTTSMDKLRTMATSRLHFGREPESRAL
jgi:hypothetical protein